MEAGSSFSKICVLILCPYPNASATSVLSIKKLHLLKKGDGDGDHFG